MSLVDNYQAGDFHPHRKALPPNAHILSRTQHPLRGIDPNQQQATHTRSPTMMSSYSQVQQGPYQHPQNTNPVQYQAHVNQYSPTTKRTPSNATASTSSTGGVPARANSTSSSQLQRSTSSRSGSSPNSYVALMRKQKATVWCDRAQQEDPRLLAAQRAAKMRAAMEVQNAHAGRGTTSLSGGVRSRIRHHGATKAQQYAPNTHPASGVPMRLSANEVDEDDSEEERHQTMSGRHHHQRTESARSSLGSGSRMSSGYSTAPQSFGIGASQPQSQPISLQRSSSEEQTSTQPQPLQHNHGPARPNVEARDSGNSDDTDREMSFGDVGGLPQRVKEPEDVPRKESADDLRRRGSVDERTMTMSGYGRLFVANPDLDD